MNSFKNKHDNDASYKTVLYTFKVPFVKVCFKFLTNKYN